MDKLVELMEAAKADYQKFMQDGNKAAGTRCRVALQNIKKLAQEIRIEIQNKKKAG